MPYKAKPKAMNLSPHLSLAEFIASDTAARFGIDNTLPLELMDAAMETAAMMERIRTFLSETAGHDVPIIILSGYRCLALNAKIGSLPTSDHVKASALDFKAPAFGTPYAVCKALVPHAQRLSIGQLIHEFGLWVHVSTRTPSKPANRVITITAKGVSLGIQEA